MPSRLLATLDRHALPSMIAPHRIEALVVSMPGPLHQAFVSVLRRRECALELARLVGVPELAAELWRDVDAECPDPAGKDSLYRADLAMVAFGSDGKARAGLLFEPQLGSILGKESRGRSTGSRCVRGTGARSGRSS